MNWEYNPLKEKLSIYKPVFTSKKKERNKHTHTHTLDTVTADAQRENIFFTLSIKITACL